MYETDNGIMVKFNSTKVSTTVKNYEGEKAYKPGDIYMDLYLRTATQMVMTDKFYGDKQDQYNEWVTLVREMGNRDPEFLLQLAAYVRNEMKLRTAPIVMLVEAALAGKVDNKYPNNQLVKHYAPHIIKRGDELAEVIAYYISVKGKIGTHTKDKNGLPNILKTVIKNELKSDKFSDHQLVKHDSNKSSVSLRDVLRIVHPAPKDEQTKEFYRKIVKKESFANIAQETWEGIISQEGSTKETWSKAITKMPIMATVRNIRNLFDNDVSEELIQRYVVNRLRDRDIISKSRMLPFRFYQAYKELNHRSTVVDAALEDAIKISTMNNVPKFDGITAIFVDVSGSMGRALNDKSSMTYAEISALFGAVIGKRCGAITTLICGYDDQVYPIDLSENDGIFYAMKRIMNTSGGGTYAYRCIQLLLDRSLRVDRIIFLSDEQSYRPSTHNNYSFPPNTIGYVQIGRNGSVNIDEYQNATTVQGVLQQYRKHVNPDVVLYDIDLSGYGTLQFDPHNPKNVMMGGWSERVFDLMSLMDELGSKSIRDVVQKAYPTIKK